MKKIAAISFLLLYLLSSTELSQLVKAPVLAQHFMEHKEKDQNLSFLEFLTMHYSQNDDHDGDRERDLKLPFKSHNASVNTIVIALNNNSFAPSNSPAVATVECNTHALHSEHFFSIAFLSSIWQPPKAC